MCIGGSRSTTLRSSRTTLSKNSSISRFNRLCERPIVLRIVRTHPVRACRDRAAAATGPQISWPAIRISGRPDPPDLLSPEPPGAVGFPVLRPLSARRSGIVFQRRIREPRRQFEIAYAIGLSRLHRCGLLFEAKDEFRTGEKSLHSVPNAGSKSPFFGPGRKNVIRAFESSRSSAGDTPCEPES